MAYVRSCVAAGHSGVSVYICVCVCVCVCVGEDGWVAG